MKNIFIISVLVLFVAGFNSCTIEKRHYRDGFYVDWNHTSTQTSETVALGVTTADTPAEKSLRMPIKFAEAISTNETVVPAKNQSNVSIVPASIVPTVQYEPEGEQTPEENNVNSEKTQPPLPLEKDKKQAVGAGIASAIFFVLGMVGLIIKGTAPPVGVFIGAAFICCVLCIVLASFLYPRDPVVKQPKDEVAVKNDGVMAAGIGLLIVVLSVFLLVVGLFFSIFTDLFF